MLAVCKVCYLLDFLYFSTYYDFGVAKPVKESDRRFPLGTGCVHTRRRCTDD